MRSLWWDIAKMVMTLTALVAGVAIVIVGIVRGVIFEQYAHATFLLVLGNLLTEASEKRMERELEKDDA